MSKTLLIDETKQQKVNSQTDSYNDVAFFDPSLFEQEQEWYKTVSRYLWTDKGFADNSLPGLYRAYAEKYVDPYVSPEDEDYFRINDIVLSIPPQNISVNLLNKHVEVPHIRGKSSISVPTGYSEIQLEISFSITENLLRKVTLSSEINYRLVPLLIQLRHMPFFVISNKYVRDQVFKAVKDTESGVNIPPPDFQYDLMFTYLGHSISTLAEMPNTLEVHLSCTLFNYLPYMSQVRFVKNYKRDKNGIIQRMGRKIVNPGFTYNPSESRAFYEFYALEYKRHQELIGLYNPRPSSNKMTLTYYTYFPIHPSLDPNLKKKDTYSDLSTLVSNERFLGKMPFENKLPSSMNTTSDIPFLNQQFQNKLKPFTYDPTSVLIKEQKVDAVKSSVNNESKSNSSYKFVLTSKYGKRGGGFHYGIDIAPADPEAKKEEIKIPIYSPANGIAKAGYGKREGNMVVLKANIHDTEYMIVFAHLEASSKNISKEKWTDIKAGELIGYMGNTGNSTGKHLHLAVAIPINDKYHKYINPLELFNKGDAFNTWVDLLFTPHGVTPEVEPEEEPKPLEFDKVSYDKLAKLLNASFGADNWEIISPPIKGGIPYVRIRNYYTFSLGYESGISLDGIENYGYTPIPRIPMSGFRFATHQYIGGHTEKATLRFTAYNEQGCKILNDIIAIFDIVSNNSHQYKHIAYLDGIGIAHDYLNTIVSGTFFTINDYSVSTHPSIPGGSVFTVDITDYTRVKEYIQRSFAFDKPLDEEDLTKAIRTLISKMRKYAKQYLKAYYLAKDYSISSGESPLKIYDSGKATALESCDIELIVRKITDNTSTEEIIKEAVFELQSILNDMSTIKYFKDGSINPKINDRYGLFDLVKDVLEDGDINYDTFKEYMTNFQLLGPEGVRGKALAESLLNKSEKRKSPRLNISQSEFHDKLARQSYSGQTDLNAYVIEWFWSYAQSLYKILKKKGEDTGLIALESLKIRQLTKPAYLDFDLPPTINPDYYFYQPKLYDDYDTKKKYKEESDESLMNAIKERYRIYKRQLDINAFSSKESAKELDSIYYALVGEVQDSNGQNNYLEELINSRHNSVSETDITAYNYTRLSQDKALYEKYYNFIERKYGSDVAKFLAPDPKSVYQNKEKLAKCVNVDEVNFLVFSDNEEFVSALFLHNAQEYRQRAEQDTLAKCFPVFKIYLIEEDDQEELSFLRDDLNEYYGLNAIQEIYLAEHDDQPVSVLNIRFIDITGRFTSMKYIQYPFTESKKYMDTGFENPIKGLLIQDGTRIQFRFGYSNNIDELPIKFNGYIASISALNETEYELVCQSYGAELVFDIHGATEPEQLDGFCNSEPKNIVHSLLLSPSLKHFGRWKLRSVNNLQFSDRRTGFSNILGSYIKLRPDGTEQRIWTLLGSTGGSFEVTPTDMNIIIPEASALEGLDEVLHKWTNDFMGALIGMVTSLDIINPAAWYRAIFDAPFADYWVYKENTYEALNHLLYRFPGYIMSVLPYEDRATLYMGPRNGVYYYREFTPYEKILIRDASRNRSSDAYKNLVTIIRSRTIKPASAYHVAASYKNIIKNSIKADFRGVYTQVEVPIVKLTRTKDQIKDESYITGSVKMKLNDFLYDEDLRTTYLELINTTEKYAYTAAAHELHLQAKNLYKGDLYMLANPEIKPHDTIFLFDTIEAMTGPIYVREHILTFSPDMGAISIIKPGMVSFINSMVQKTVFDAFGSYLFDSELHDFVERMTGGYLPAAIIGYNVLRAGSAAASVAAGGTMSIVGALVVVVGLGMGISLATTLVNLAKNRQPIFLQPLMKDGIPYLFGVHHYKIGSMIQWIEHKWHIFTLGLKFYEEFAQSFIDSLFGET